VLRRILIDSSFAAQSHSILFLPAGASGASNSLRVPVTLAHTSVLLSGTGETAQLAMVVLRRHYPVDGRIPADVNTNMRNLYSYFI